MRLAPGLFLVLLLLLAAAPARAAEVDGSFGSGGSVTLRSLGPDVLARAVAVQPDGRIVAATDNGGGLTVLRFTSRGRLDRSFGTRGHVTVAVPGAFAAAARDVAVFRDGRIIVAGFADTSGAGTRRLAVARLLPGGDLDPSFGTDGVAVVGPEGSDVEAIALGSEGEVVLAGSIARGPRTAVLVMRLLADATPDPGFGSGRVVTSDSVRLAGRARDVLVLPGGAVALAASTEPDVSARGTFIAARLTAAGAFDTSFNVDGVVRVLTTRRRLTGGGAAAIVPGPGGRLVLAGTVRAAHTVDQAVVLRLTGSGGLDRSFGRRGSVQLTAPHRGSLRLGALARGHGGSLVAGGSARGSAAVLRVSGRGHGARLSLLALGHPPGGRRRASLIDALAIARDGRILTGGGVTGRRNVFPTLARLLAH